MARLECCWSSVLRIALALCALLSGHGAAVAQAAFDPNSGLVTLPSVQVGSQVYTGVKLAHLGNYVFKLVSATGPVASSATIDATYDAATSMLSIPMITVGSASYADVTLENVGDFTFGLRSATERHATRLYLNVGDSCAAYANTATLLCPTFNGVGTSSFVTRTSTSSIDFSTTLAGPMTGSGYLANIRLLSGSSTYQARVRIILKSGQTETVLFESAPESVSTTHNFSTSGTGAVANGAAGDTLIVRVSCTGGQCGIIFGQPYFMGVSINATAPSYIEVPSVTVR